MGNVLCRDRNTTNHNNSTVNNEATRNSGGGSSAVKSPFQRIVTRIQLRPTFQTKKTSKEKRSYRRSASDKNSRRKFLVPFYTANKKQQIFESNWADVDMSKAATLPAIFADPYIRRTPKAPPRKHRKNVTNETYKQGIYSNCTISIDYLSEDRSVEVNSNTACDLAKEKMIMGKVKEFSRESVTDSKESLVLRKNGHQKSLSTVSLPNYSSNLTLCLHNTIDIDEPIPKTNLFDQFEKKAVNGKFENYIVRCRSFGSLLPQQFLDKFKTHRQLKPERVESDDSWKGLEDWDLAVIEHYKPKDSTLPRSYSVISDNPGGGNKRKRHVEESRSKFVLENSSTQIDRAVSCSNLVSKKSSLKLHRNNKNDKLIAKKVDLSDKSKSTSDEFGEVTVKKAKGQKFLSSIESINQILISKFKDKHAGEKEECVNKVLVKRFANECASNEKIADISFSKETKTAGVFDEYPKPPKRNEAVKMRKQLMNYGNRKENEKMDCQLNDTAKSVTNDSHVACEKNLSDTPIIDQFSDRRSTSEEVILLESAQISTKDLETYPPIEEVSTVDGMRQISKQFLDEEKVKQKDSSVVMNSECSKNELLSDKECDDNEKLSKVVLYLEKQLLDEHTKFGQMRLTYMVFLEKITNQLDRSSRPQPNLLCLKTKTTPRLSCRLEYWNQNGSNSIQAKAMASCTLPIICSAKMKNNIKPKCIVGNDDGRCFDVEANSINSQRSQSEHNQISSKMACVASFVSSQNIDEHNEAIDTVKNTNELCNPISQLAESNLKENQIHDYHLEDTENGSQGRRRKSNDSRESKTSSSSSASSKITVISTENNDTSEDNKTILIEPELNETIIELNESSSTVTSSTSKLPIDDESNVTKNTTAENDDVSKAKHQPNNDGNSDTIQFNSSHQHKFCYNADKDRKILEDVHDKDNSLNASESSDHCALMKVIKCMSQERENTDNKSNENMKQDRVKTELTFERFLSGFLKGSISDSDDEV